MIKSIRKLMTLSIVILPLLFFCLSLSACEKKEGPAETAGQKVDQAAEETQKEAAQVKENAGEKVDQAIEETKETAAQIKENVEEKTSQMVEAAQEEAAQIKENAEEAVKEATK